MEYQILLEVDSGLDITDTDVDGNYVIGNEVVSAISNLTPWWPRMLEDISGGDIMPGTRVHNNRKVIHASVLIDAEDPLVLIEGLISLYGLNWSLLAMVSLDTFFVPPTGGASEGTLEPVVERQVPPSMIDFLSDVYDDKNNAARPTAPVPLSTFSGRYQLIVPA